MAAVHLSKMDSVLAAREVVCGVSEVAPHPAWSYGSEIKFHATQAPALVDLADYVDLMGLNNHELAHILLTPAPDTIQAVLRDVFPSDSIRLDVLLRTSAEHRMSYNMLEDQRIENIMAKMYPSMAKFFTAAVTRYCLEKPDYAWLLLCGRLSLPQELRRAARAYFAADKSIRLLAERVIREYITLDLRKKTDLIRAGELVDAFTDIRRRININPADQPPSCDRSGDRVSEARTAADREKISSDIDKAIEKVKQEGQGVKKSDEKSEAADEAASKKGDGKDLGEKHSDLQEAKKEAREDVNSDAEVIRHAKDTRDTVQGDKPFYSSNREQPVIAGAIEASSKLLMNSLVKQIRKVEDEVDSGWELRTNSGKLNMGRVRRAEHSFRPGLYDRWQPGASPDQSFEICVLLDKSSSMRESKHGLQQAAWILKRMGDVVNANTSVWTYNSTSHLLYPASERVDPAAGVPAVNPSGTTDPSGALRDAYYTLMRTRRRRRLLLIMTDGQWNANIGYTQPWLFENPDDLILGLGEAGVVTAMIQYGKGASASSDAHKAMLSLHITDLARQMPILMKDIVTTMLRIGA